MEGERRSKKRLKISLVIIARIILKMLNLTRMPPAFHAQPAMSLPQVFPSKPSMSKQVFASSFPWKSSPHMTVSYDTTVSPEIPKLAALLTEELVAKAIPFTATTRLGAKQTTWSIKGLYVPCKTSSTNGARTLLCLHGHGSCCTALSWSNLFPHFHDSHSIIAIDAPCFGRSSGPSGQANLWRIDDALLINRLLESFKTAPNSVDVAAQCMGAGMTMRAFAANPSFLI